MFNRGLGFTEEVDRLPSAVAFFERYGVAGEVILDATAAPPGIEPRLRLDVHAAAPRDVAPAPVTPLTIRSIRADEADAWMAVAIAAISPSPEVAAVWRSMARHMAGTPDQLLSVAEIDGRIVAAASLFVSDGVGLQSWASVLPDARGRGIQRALIADRARAAEDAGCDLVAAWALAGGHSSANLERAGLQRIGQRIVVRAADLG
jgi:GNAT superfamily N-acetyltransferase